MSHRVRDGGFTLIEVLVTIGLSGVMAALAIAGYARWAESSAHIGTAREVQTVMRQAQQQAVTEGFATCVSFNDAADTYTVYRGPCGAPTKTLKGPHSTASKKIQLSAPSFAVPPSVTGVSVSPGVTFFARGTATAGGVKVIRPGSTKVYLLDVEGLTGRVSLL